MIEQRKYPRKRIDIPLLYSYNEQGRLKKRDSIRMVKNISKGGFCFLEEMELTSGTSLFIKLNIIEKIINCTGTVVRCQKTKTSSGYDIGVEFTAISDDDREKIVCCSPNIYG